MGSHEVSAETRVWGGVPLPEREVTTGKWLLWEVTQSARGHKGLGRSTAPRRGSYDREVAPVGSHTVSVETRVWGGVPLPEGEVTTGKWLLWEVTQSARGDKGLGRSTAPRRGSYDREVAPVGSHAVSGETRVWGGVPLPEHEVTTGKWLLWEVTQSARGHKGLGKSTAPRRGSYDREVAGSSI